MITIMSDRKKISTILLSHLMLDLRGDVLSTNRSFKELKTLAGKIVAEGGESVIKKAAKTEFLLPHRLKASNF